MKIYIPDPVRIEEPKQQPVNYIDPVVNMLCTMFKCGVVFISLLLGCCWIVAVLNGG